MFFENFCVKDTQVTILIWLIAILSFIGILSRPFKLPEWIFAVSGALLLVATNLLSITEATKAALKGADVYFFLIGMMVLSELAREEGVFTWLAELASFYARGSSKKLMLLIYGAGMIVTTLLSNDATAVVLTPAVYAAVKKSGAKPLPYLFACAFVANAASFVLPISNPANLVVYSDGLPSIWQWLAIYLLPSIASIVITYGVLYYWFHDDLKMKLESSAQPEALNSSGRMTLLGLGFVVVALIVASLMRMDLGVPTFCSACLVLAVVSVYNRNWPKKLFGQVSWSVIPLVAGLFIVVEALNAAGALSSTWDFFSWASKQNQTIGKLSSAFGVGIVSNLVNNLPVGLTSGLALQKAGITEAVRSAVLIGIDLGPNLSVTGSLATILWLMAIRREGENVSSWKFLAVGAVAMPLALAVSVLLILANSAT